MQWHWPQQFPSPSVHKYSTFTLREQETFVNKLVFNVKYNASTYMKHFVGKSGTISLHRLQYFRMTDLYTEGHSTSTSALPFWINLFKTQLHSLSSNKKRPTLSCKSFFIVVWSQLGLNQWLPVPIAIGRVRCSLVYLKLVFLTSQDMQLSFLYRSRISLIWSCAQRAQHENNPSNR